MLHEAEDTIHFESEDIDFDLPDHPGVRHWLLAVSKAENSEIQALTFIFCSDEYLHNMNQEYLQHDNYTDVITFDYAEKEGVTEGDVFISVDRVKENAISLNVTFLDELHRIMAHGLLHLLGYKDKTPEDVAVMREKEDYYLSLRSF